MKVSVFCSEKYKTELPRLRLALDDFFIEYQTVLISENSDMNNSIASLKLQLESSSIYLLILHKQDYSKQWFSYVMGYTRFIHENVILYTPAAIAPLWIDNYNICPDFETFIKSIEKSIHLWNKQLKESMALETLKDRIKEHNHQTFAQSVQEGNRFLAGVFLEAGFDVNKLSSDQVSLLALAARHGFKSIAEVLVEAGADVDLISLDRNNTPLMDAASEGHEELVRFFIDKGASLDIKSKSGQTALILATGNGHQKCAEILIKAGADCDQKDSMGLSARKYARLYKLDLLLDIMPEAVE